MDDQRTGGGAANTPPFPRLVRNDADGGPIGGVGGGPSPVSPPPIPMAGSRGTSGDDGPGAIPPRSTSRPSTEPREQPPLAGSALPFSARARREIRRHAAGTLNRGFERVADRLEDAAERIERLAEERLEGAGPRARAGELAFSAAGWIDEFADYIRSTELEEIGADLQRRVRERPIQSMLLAAGTGWILGKILR